VGLLGGSLLALAAPPNPPPPAPAPAPNTAPAPVTGPRPAPGDTEKVEAVNGARRQYRAALEELYKHYQKVGDNEKLKMVEEELRGYHRLNKHVYRVDLDVPGNQMRAKYNYAESNDLYLQAREFKNKGSWGGTDGADNLIRAELLYQELLTKYPECDKIGDTAYDLAEIYASKVFNRQRLAAVYYERSFEWNPTTRSEARIRAARIYDKVLREQVKAIDLYRNVLSHDTDPARLAEAKKRLAEMNGGK
jgi:hypothetical protein